MSTEAGDYCTITRDEKGEITNVEVEDAGHITKDTIGTFKYVFSAPNDITDSLKKSNNGDIPNDSTSQSGRISYSSCAIHYPDNSAANTAVLEDCVLQYRPNLKAESPYGRTYVTAGIPIAYGSEFIKHARSSAGINAGFKGADCDGYFWVDISLEKITPADVAIVVVDGNGEPQLVPISVADALEAMKSSIVVDMVCAIGASAASPDLNARINPKTAQYYIKPKPSTIYIKGDTPVKGPQLALRRSKNVERAALSERSIATGKLALLAMSRLKLD